jgi:hypothetical protein
MSAGAGTAAAAAASSAAACGAAKGCSCGCACASFSTRVAVFVVPHAAPGTPAACGVRGSTCSTEVSSIP